MKTDVSRLLSMTRATFDEFTHLLEQEQGLHLEVLSRFIEPSVMALVTKSLDKHAECYLQQFAIPPLIENNLPKGLITHRLMSLVA